MFYIEVNKKEYELQPSSVLYQPHFWGEKIYVYNYVYSVDKHKNFSQQNFSLKIKYLDICSKSFIEKKCTGGLK